MAFTGVYKLELPLYVVNLCFEASDATALVQALVDYPPVNGEEYKSLGFGEESILYSLDGSFYCDLAYDSLETRDAFVAQLGI